MTEESRADEIAAEDAPADQPRPQATHRPTAAASAASRARRIGGARTPAPTPAAPADPEAHEAPAAPVPMQKSAKASVKASAESEPAASAAPAASDAPDKDRVVLEVPAWLRWVPAGVLSVCAIAMLVLLVVAAHGVWYSKPSGTAVRDQVLAAAKTCTAAANTYSYQTLPQDEKKGLACSTGLWSSQYRKAIKTIVTPAATRLKASQSIQINAAGIENVSSNGEQWTIIVYGQTKVTQAGQKARLDPFSAQVRMQHVGGKWLISKIDLVVNPNT